MKRNDTKSSRELYPKSFLQLELTYDHGDVGSEWQTTLYTD